MKKAGIVIFIIGILMTIYTSITYVTKEKVVDIGEIEVTKDEKHTESWSPLIGIGIMVIGGAFFFLSKKKHV